jgi:hypothetical protein
VPRHDVAGLLRLEYQELAAFKDITLTTIHMAGQVHRHLTPLSVLQQHILALLDFSADIYTRLSATSE